MSLKALTTMTISQFLRPLLSAGLLSVAVTLRAAEPTSERRPVVELASFRLKPGASADQLLAASPSVDRFLAGCPGFISRLLVEEPDGRFTDIVVWRSGQDAADALKRHEAQPEACSDYLCLMLESDGAMKHLPVLHAAPALR